jgi:heme a synthase
VLLGVLTVLAASPLSLSLMHQAGGVALWAAALVSARLAWR